MVAESIWVPLPGAALLGTGWQAWFWPEDRALPVTQGVWWGLWTLHP